MRLMDKLRECPFCGGEAMIIETGTGIDMAGYVQCKKCLACSFFFLGEGYQEQAVKSWNTRHEPPTPGGIIVPAGNERFKK